MRSLFLMTIAALLLLPEAAWAQRTQDLSVRVEAWRRGGEAPSVAVRATPVDATGSATGAATEVSGLAGALLSLGALPDGRYVIDAAAGGYDATRGQVDVVDDTEVLLEVWPADAVLVQGVVRSAGGPLSNARVGVWPLPPRAGDTPAFGATTDETGAFTIGAIPASFADVVIEADGFESLRLSSVDMLAHTTLTLALEVEGSDAEVRNLGRSCAHTGGAPLTGSLLVLGGVVLLRRRRRC